MFVVAACNASLPADVSSEIDVPVVTTPAIVQEEVIEPEEPEPAPPVPDEIPPAPTPDPYAPLAAPPPSLVGKAIVVDQSIQMMAIFEDGVEIRRMPVSTGRPTYTTYTLPWNGYVGEHLGTFLSYTGGKADNAWFVYQAGGAIYIHGAPYHEVDGVKEYYELDALGNYPASAGCIRLHPDDAQWLTDWGPLNAAIRITEWPGTIAGLIGDPLPYP
jgi:lipoprotein-anchoring transpeptidase ErfK/SrfK